jgi:hypothetical protein
MDARFFNVLLAESIEPKWTKNHNEALNYLFKI